jgi:NAD(P)-dependent dehydrogenase (short-subunit alcohol dehydrogenase family)
MLVFSHCELSDQRILTGTALVTGGGRGTGAAISRALAADGWDVVVAARTAAQVEEVASEVGGRAVEVDVSDVDAVDRAVAEIGDVDVLVANAGVNQSPLPSWEIDLDEWRRAFDVNVHGVHFACRAVIPGMLARGTGRILICGSGAGHMAGLTMTEYGASKAAAIRYGDSLSNELAGRIPVFVYSPGLVQTAMTEPLFAVDSPWTPPENVARLVARLASGAYDALAGRYIHAEQDDLDDLLARAEDVIARDLNTVRLQR